MFNPIVSLIFISLQLIMQHNSHLIKTIYKGAHTPRAVSPTHRAGQYLNTLYLNTVFKYIYCIYTLYLNTFFNLYLITVFKYCWNVFKYTYLNTFLNTFLHTPLNINNRSSVDWSANHGFKHFNTVTCCICLLINNTVLYPLLCYISQLKIFI